MKKTKGELSFFSVLLLGMNGIIGSGAFLLPKVLFQQSGIYSLLAILLGGMGSFMIAIHYAALSSKIKGDGGAWLYTDKAFGPLAAFQVGWFSWLVGVIAISAEIAAFLTTLDGVIPLSAYPHLKTILALSLILFLTVINLFGAHLLKIFNNLSSIMKIAILASFIIGGLYFLQNHAVSFHPLEAKEVTPNQFAQSFSTSFFMFTGFSFLPIAASSMKNPQNVLPKVTMVVLTAVTFIYVCIQFVSMLVLKGALGHSELPVAQAFAEIFGPLGKTVILIGMLIGILGVTISLSFSTPVGLSSLGENKAYIPAFLSKKNRYQAPYSAILLTQGIAALLVLSDSYLFLVRLIVLSTFVQYIGTILSYLKLSQTDLNQIGMNLPFGKLLSYLSLLLIGYLMTSFDQTTYFFTFLFGLLGYVIYTVNYRKRRMFMVKE